MASSSPSTPQRPRNIVARDTRSKALMPSIDKTVAPGSVSVKTCNWLWWRVRIETVQLHFSQTLPPVTLLSCQPIVESRPRRCHSSAFLLQCRHGWHMGPGLFTCQEEQMPIMVESNSGRKCSLVMPEGLPVDPRLDERNVRKKRFSSSSNKWDQCAYFLRNGFSSDIGPSSRVSQFPQKLHHYLVQVQLPRGPASLTTIPRPKQLLAPSRLASPPLELPSCDVGGTLLMLLQRIWLLPR